MGQSPPITEPLWKMAWGTELDIGNISALIIESADREREAKLIKTNKKDKEYRKNTGFSWISSLFARGKRERKAEGWRLWCTVIVCVRLCVFSASTYVYLCTWACVWSFTILIWEFFSCVWLWLVHTHSSLLLLLPHLYVCIFLDWLNLGWMWTLQLGSKACTTSCLPTHWHLPRSTNSTCPPTRQHTHWQRHQENKPHKSPCIISILSWQIYTSCQSMALCEYYILPSVIDVCVHGEDMRGVCWRLALPGWAGTRRQWERERALSILIGPC